MRFLEVPNSEAVQSTSVPTSQAYKVTQHNMMNKEKGRSKMPVLVTHTIALGVGLAGGFFFGPNVRPKPPSLPPEPEYQSVDDAINHLRSATNYVDDAWKRRAQEQRPSQQRH